MSVEMQLQMRRNVEAVHDVVGDLDSWLGDIGKRDAQLRGVAAPTGGGRARGAADDGTDDEEEAREIDEAKKELRKLAAEQEAEAATKGGTGQPAAAEKVGSKGGSKGPLTHAQKYGKWEQYDADSVVDHMDKKEADREQLRKEVVRLENRRAQSQARKQVAAAAAASEALRLQGNEAFGAARYEEAVGLYTDALGHAPRSAALYANRALALLKLHAHAEAEEDCDAALLIEPSHVKALLRRAQARHAEAKYDGALEDLERALEAEPRNSAARSLMAECRRLKTLATPRPKAPLVRVSVEEVEHDPDNDADAFVLALAEEPSSRSLPEGEHNAATVAAPAGADAASTGADAASFTAMAGEPSGTSDGSRDAEGDAASVSAGGLKVGGSRGSAPSRARAVPNAAPTAESFALPNSLADMERGWRSLKSRPEQWAAWVARIEPSAMASMFKTTLPDDLFSALLLALDGHLSHSDAPRTLAILRALTCAGRFSILTMCLDKADRCAIDAINIRLIEAQGRGEIAAEEDLEALRKQYA